MDFISIVNAVSSGGPYALMVAIAIAYWRKDQYINELHKGILKNSLDHLDALRSLQTAVNGLRETIQIMLNKR